MLEFMSLASSLVLSISKQNPFQFFLLINKSLVK